MNNDPRQHPGYHEGFNDALDDVPLFDDASDPYKAGWTAAMDCRRIFAELD